MEQQQFLDFVKYLQTKLDAIQEGFSVSSERRIDSNFMEKEVVVSALSGNIFDESATIPYQIDITTSDIDNVNNVFTILARNENNRPFTNIVNEGTEEVPDMKRYEVTPYFNTPVVMEKDIEIGSDHYARVTVFVSLVILFNTTNVSSIEIDGEEIKFLDGTFNYVAELNSNRVSGEQLNKSKKRTSSISLAFRFVNRDNNFSRKLFRIAVGTLPGNTNFEVKVTLTNGLSATLEMIVGSSSLAFARQQLASYNISMYLYDSRGDTNAAS